MRVLCIHCDTNVAKPIRIIRDTYNRVIVHTFCKGCNKEGSYIDLIDSRTPTLKSLLKIIPVKNVQNIYKILAACLIAILMQGCSQPKNDPYSVLDKISFYKKDSLQKLIEENNKKYNYIPNQRINHAFDSLYFEIMQLNKDPKPIQSIAINGPDAEALVYNIDAAAKAIKTYRTRRGKRHE